ncbi:XRE family transcriptional regulator [Campylobacter fetus]|uniref:XRE family transcriptional regulator n=1 Tax=Campylobacter fetus TaxID=196 RepID=UPI00138DD9F7|nr:XRE family transcriptional regulator [Campylobacter fetus]
MEMIEFEEVLKKTELTKRDFSGLTGVAYQTIINWGSTNKIPPWVSSWLQNYIKSKSYERVKNEVLDIEGIKGD